jgi:hypothetical protein
MFFNILKTNILICYLFLICDKEQNTSNAILQLSF